MGDVLPLQNNPQHHTSTALACRTKTHDQYLSILQNHPERPNQYLKILATEGATTGVVLLTT
jgi:hypothetical protein